MLNLPNSPLGAAQYQIFKTKKKKIIFNQLQYYFFLLVALLCIPMLAFGFTKKHATVVDLIQQGIDPLIADCAAHASFIIPLSRKYYQISFDAQNLLPPFTSIEIWNQPFALQKQRVEVEKIVKIECKANTKTDKKFSHTLKVRCGYIKNILLAFDFFDAKTIPQRRTYP